MGRGSHQRRVGLRSERPGVTGPGAVDVVGPVAPSGRASGCEGAQECTQIDENGPSGPFWDMRIIPTNESMRSTLRKTPLDVG